MPRPRSTQPKICHHKASHRAYITLDGKEVYLGRWNRRHDEPSEAARKKYEAIMRRRLAQACGPLPAACGTIAEVALAYLGHVARLVEAGRRRASEISHVRTVIRALCRTEVDADGTTADALDVSDFSPKKLRLVRDTIIADGLARKTCNQHVQRIRAMVRWAGEEELIDPIIYQRLLVVSGLREGDGGRETAERIPALWPEVQAVRELVSRQVWAMIELQWCTGMRSQNVVEITTGRIDRSGPVWFYTPASDKSRKKRKRKERLLIALGPKAQAVLTPWLRFNPDEPLFSPAEAEAERREWMRANRRTKLWPSHARRYQAQRRARPERAPGDRYTPQSYRHAIARALRIAFPVPAEFARRPGEIADAWRERL
ncbi:MAG: tyrosine-type recombinase/integrase, partial [Planctomycetes bacterium]|nr:tyrosine-type recombinase/integrase [Planctomycetota bacterium]